MKKNNQQRGFTLFLAIVITATLLLISTGIVSVAVKEAFLTTSNRDSQYAFYAADSGVECALFWDLKNPSISAFDLSQPIDGVTIYCNEQTIDSFGGGAIGESRFTVFFPPGDSCAEVYVRKLPPNQSPRTMIESYGYNSCDEDKPRRIQRALRVTY
ncbi:MAG: pilus assembly PilX family protein [Minisyncoccota bacterium]